MNVKDLYGYRKGCSIIGIVKANSEEDARRKVYEAYNNHVDSFDSYNDEIEIWKIIEDPWFNEEPDVLEISLS